AQAYVPNPAAQAFTEVPEDGGAAVEPAPLPMNEVAPVAEELPASFDNYGPTNTAQANYEIEDSYGAESDEYENDSYGSNAYSQNTYGATNSGNNVTIDTGAGEE